MFITAETPGYPDVGAKGEGSHIEGICTNARNKGEHAEGKYNSSNIGTIHSIGIGTSNDDRKNAVEVMQSGEVYVNGIGSYNGTNPMSGTNDLKTIIDSKSVVSGVDDGTNWTSLTIDGTTKSISTGGGDSVWQSGSGSNSAVLKHAGCSASGSCSVAEG